MISPSPDSYGYVQVDRPVLDGHKAFLSQVREIGRQVLGTETRASLAELAFTDGAEEGVALPELVEMPVGEDRLTVTDDNRLRLILLHRAASKEVASKYSFAYIQMSLASNREVKAYQTVNTGEGKYRAEFSYPSLTDQFAAISREANLDPAASWIEFDGVQIVGEPGRHILLGLTPKAATLGSLVLARQSKAAFTALQAVSKRTAFPTSHWSMVAPFAKFSSEITGHEYTRLVERISREAGQLVLKLGEPEYNSADRKKASDQIMRRTQGR